MLNMTFADACKNIKKDKQGITVSKLTSIFKDIFTVFMLPSDK